MFKKASVTPKETEAVVTQPSAPSRRFCWTLWNIYACGNPIYDENGLVVTPPVVTLPDQGK